MGERGLLKNSKGKRKLSSDHILTTININTCVNEFFQLLKILMALEKVDWGLKK